MKQEKPTGILLVGFFVDSAWKMKFFFIFRVELIFYCYICAQKSAKSGGASAIEKHFIAFGFLRPDGSKRPKVERHRLCHQKSTETHFNDVYGHHSSWHATQRHDDY